MAILLLVSAALPTGVTLSSPALAQGTSTPTPSPGAFLDISSNRGFILLLILIAIVMLVWFIPFMTDLVMTHRSQRDAIQGRGGSALVGTPGAGNQPSFSRRHLVRALIALTIVTIVGVALLLVLSGNTTDATDLRKTLVAGVVAIVGTVVGFYFGGRTAESAAAATTGQSTGTVTLTPTTAEFTALNPQRVFTLFNNSPEPVTVMSAAVTNGNTGFKVETAGQPPGWWDGNTTIIPPSKELSICISWAQPAQPAAGAPPFRSTLTIAHTGSGAPSAQLQAT